MNGSNLKCYDNRCLTSTRISHFWAVNPQKSGPQQVVFQLVVKNFSCTVCGVQILGRWLYIGGSSDLPGSRSLGRLLTSAWLDVTATAQSNILNLFQTHRM